MGGLLRFELCVVTRVAAGGTRAGLMRWRSALRADFACDARARVARHNSLRDLRSLRSNKCRESVDDARAWRRAPTPALRVSPPLNRPSLCRAGASMPSAERREPQPSSPSTLSALYSFRRLYSVFRLTPRTAAVRSLWLL